MTLPRHRRNTLAAVTAAGLVLAAAASTLYAPAEALPDRDPRGGDRRGLDISEIGRIGGLGAEIVAYDRRNDRAWVTDADEAEVSLVDVSEPDDPQLVRTVSLAEYGATVTSVAIAGRHAVVGTRPDAGAGALARGTVVLLDLEGNVTDTVTAGFGPDAVTFTPDGDRVLVANEGEPAGYEPGDADPPGSVSILQVRRGRFAEVREVGFTGLSSVPEGVRIASPAPTIAQDLEPEYVTVADNSGLAYVTLQENNAVAVIDVRRARLEAIHPVGYADHAGAAHGIDASDEDGPGGDPAIGIKARPAVLGMRMPDAIDTLRYRGETYVLTANEGDAREYDGLPGGSDDQRVKDFDTDDLPAAWGSDTADLQADDELGRLTVTKAAPWAPGGPLYAYGSRSFSVFDERGELVFDSGADFEQITAAAVPDLFNSELGDPGEFDARSDNKGPEPEGLTVGSAFGRDLAVITLERTGGIMVYDVSDPRRPRFVDYVAGDAGNAGPEGVLVVRQRGQSLILTASEEGPGGGALTVYEINRR